MQNISVQTVEDIVVDIVVSRCMMPAMRLAAVMEAVRRVKAWRRVVACLHDKVIQAAEPSRALTRRDAVYCATLVL